MATLMQPKTNSLGAPCRGKSMCYKAELERVLHHLDDTTDIIIVDPDREWQKLIKEGRQGGRKDGETDEAEKR